MNKTKTFLMFLLSGGLLLSSCGNPDNSGNEEGKGEGEGSGEKVDYGEVRINDVYAWVGENQPLTDFYPHFSIEDKKEELIFEPTIEGKLEIDAEHGLIKALEPGNWEVKAHSEHFETSFMVKAQAVDPNSSKFDASSFDRYVSAYKTKWADYGTANTTVFIGDSFFDPGIFWTDFDANYGKYDMMTLGVSTAKTQHWETMAYKIFGDKAPKNIAIHLGTNNVYNSEWAEDAPTLIPNVQRMLLKLHTLYPTTHIFYYGITQRSYETRVGQDYQIVSSVNQATSDFAEERAWLTFSDATLQLTPDRLKDKVHPKIEYYYIFVDALKDLGVEFVDNPYLYIVKDIVRTQENKVGDAPTIKYGGLPIDRNFYLTGDFVIKTMGENAHIAIQFVDGNRILLWDPASTLNKLRVGGQVGGTHECKGTYININGETTIGFKMLVTDNDAYLWINGTLMEVMTNFGENPSGVRFGTEHLDMLYANLNVKTLRDNKEEYEAIVAENAELIDKYGSLLVNSIFYPDINPSVPSIDGLDDVAWGVTDTVTSAPHFFNYKGSPLSRNFSLQGKWTFKAKSSNPHVQLQFNSDNNTRFLFWMNDNTGKITTATFNHSRGSVNYEYSDGCVYYFRIVVTDTSAYFYIGETADSFKLRAVAVNIAEPSDSSRGFNMAGQHFDMTLTELKACSKAVEPELWENELKAMESTIKNYTTTCNVNN